MRISDGSSECARPICIEDGVGEGHGNAPSQQMTNPIADRPAALDSFVSIVQPGKEQAGQLAARDTFKSTLPFRQAAASRPARLLSRFPGCPRGRFGILSSALPVARTRVG